MDGWIREEKVARQQAHFVGDSFPVLQTVDALIAYCLLYESEKCVGIISISHEFIVIS